LSFSSVIRVSWMPMFWDNHLAEIGRASSISSMLWFVNTFQANSTSVEIMFKPENIIQDKLKTIFNQHNLIFDCHFGVLLDSTNLQHPSLIIHKLTILRHWVVIEKIVIFVAVNNTNLNTNLFDRFGGHGSGITQANCSPSGILIPNARLCCVNWRRIALSCRNSIQQRYPISESAILIAECKSDRFWTPKGSDSLYSSCEICWALKLWATVELRDLSTAEAVFANKLGSSEGRAGAFCWLGAFEMIALPARTSNVKT
jgi:hypothetical protein